MECTTTFCHICRNHTEAGAGVCAICLKVLPLESEIKKEVDILSDQSLKEMEETKTTFCHICRNPTEAEAGVCAICLKDLPLESEIKKEVDLPSGLSLKEMNEDESFDLEWIKLGRDLFLNAYCSHQISLKTLVSGE